MLRPQLVLFTNTICNLYFLLYTYLTTTVYIIWFILLAAIAMHFIYFLGVFKKLYNLIYCIKISNIEILYILHAHLNMTCKHSENFRALSCRYALIELKAAWNEVGNMTVDQTAPKISCIILINGHSIIGHLLSIDGARRLTWYVVENSL